VLLPLLPLDGTMPLLLPLPPPLDPPLLPLLLPLAGPPLEEVPPTFPPQSSDTTAVAAARPRAHAARRATRDAISEEGFMGGKDTAQGGWVTQTEHGPR
jgi:hypothetical protein